MKTVDNAFFKDTRLHLILFVLLIVGACNIEERQNIIPIMMSLRKAHEQNHWRRKIRSFIKFKVG